MTQNTKKTLKQLDFKTVATVVAGYYGKPEKDLLNPRRTADLAQMRAVFSFMSNKFVKYAGPSNLGKFLGRDHTTVIHHKKIVQDAIDTKNADWLKYIDPIDRQLTKLATRKRDQEPQRLTELLAELVQAGELSLANRYRILKAIENENSKPQ